jgi:hypothetical protein
MFYAPKGALRVGAIDNGPLIGASPFSFFTNQWDKDSIGWLSFATGLNTKAKGKYSVATGFVTSATGDASTAVGNGSIATGSSSFAAGAYSTATGICSFSMGYLTNASGDYSFSTGNYSNATAINSVAIGYGAFASGGLGIAIGNYTGASGSNAISIGNTNNAQGPGAISIGASSLTAGTNSIAIGEELIVKPYDGVAVGAYNDNTDNPVGNNIDSVDRVFQVGNGSIAGRRNAITVLRNGKVGVGTVLPIARLHVADSAVLFTGLITNVSASFNPPPVEGKGTRMMWYPEKSALRVGTIDDGMLLQNNPGLYSTHQWDKDSIGLFSLATGFNTTAKGIFSTAMGGYTKANGEDSIALGDSTMANGSYSTAIGYNTLASGRASFAGVLAQLQVGKMILLLGILLQPAESIRLQLGN